MAFEETRAVSYTHLIGIEYVFVFNGERNDTATDLVLRDFQSEHLLIREGQFLIHQNH